MSRASRRDNSTSTSLMPFLAVLLCTMGVLVVLLVVMASVQLTHAENKQNDASAQQQAARDSPEQQALRKQLADIEAQKQRLAQIRDQAANQLGVEEQRLSQIEENIRRRLERLALLRAEVEELKTLDGGQVDDLIAANAELDRLKSLLLSRQSEIARLEEEANSRETAYAIVPYSGPDGTRRRPIYVECRRDVVILQPEGVALAPQDFNGALKVGNPLSAAIRAAQRHYLDRAAVSPERPYVLFLVRPDGLGSMYHARQAISNTSCDYGYEMVAADWPLDFRAANPEISDEMTMAIANAQQRLAALQDNAPQEFMENAVASFEIEKSWVQRVEAGDLPSNVRVLGPSSGSQMGRQSERSPAVGASVYQVAEALRAAGRATASPTAPSAGGEADSNDSVAQPAAEPPPEAGSMARMASSDAEEATDPLADLATKAPPTQNEAAGQPTAASAQADTSQAAIGATSAAGGDPAAANLAEFSQLATEGQSRQEQAAGDSGMTVERPIRIFIGANAMEVGPRPSDADSHGWKLRGLVGEAR